MGGHSRDCDFGWTLWRSSNKFRPVSTFFTPWGWDQFPSPPHPQWNWDPHAVSIRQLCPAAYGLLAAKQKDTSFSASADPKSPKKVPFPCGLRPPHSRAKKYLCFCFCRPQEPKKGSFSLRPTASSQQSKKVLLFLLLQTPRAQKRFLFPAAYGLPTAKQKGTSSSASADPKSTKKVPFPCGLRPPHSKAKRYLFFCFCRPHKKGSFSLRPTASPQQSNKAPLLLLLQTPKSPKKAPFPCGLRPPHSKAKRYLFFCFCRPQKPKKGTFFASLNSRPPVTELHNHNAPIREPSTRSPIPLIFRESISAQ